MLIYQPLLALIEVQVQGACCIQCVPEAEKLPVWQHETEVHVCGAGQQLMILLQNGGVSNTLHSAQGSCLPSE
jgi:hypothetical protein